MVHFPPIMFDGGKRIKLSIDIEHRHIAFQNMDRSPQPTFKREAFPELTAGVKI